MPIIGRLSDRLPAQARMILRICIYGIVAGLATVAFQLATNGLYRHGILASSSLRLPIFAAASLAIITVTSLIAGLLLRFCPEAAGSGIPQLKVAFWKDEGRIRLKVGLVKFIAGALSIGGGSSLGREGPSVQIAGAIGSNIAGAMGKNRRLGTAAGAAAGLAAAFNTPLAGITFVLEELIGDLGSRYLGGLLLASVLGSMTVQWLIGNHPAFRMPTITTCDWTVYATAPLVAAAAALVGVGFQHLTTKLRARVRGFRTIPRWLMPALGALITWAIAMVVYLRSDRLGVFSLGYDDLSDALVGKLDWQVAGLLLAGKFLATTACYGLGGSGGIFAPSLFLGGMTGVVLANLLGLVTQIGDQGTMALALIGMAATLGAVVRAPFTSILIIFEMTREFTVVPVLMLATIISQIVSRKVLKHGIYDALLIQDGLDPATFEPPHDLHQWQQMPISLIANRHPVVLKALDKAHLEILTQKYHYSRFPVIEGNRLLGILTRDQAMHSIKEGLPAKLLPAITCTMDDPIGQVQDRLITSSAGLAVIWDQQKGSIEGIVTLHDILRAQSTFASQGLDESSERLLLV